MSALTPLQEDLVRSVRRHRSGMTLVEMVVALTILALAAGLVAPAILEPISHETTLQSVVSGARALAISRAQTLDLRIKADGAWDVRTLPPTTILAEGSLVKSAPAIRISITPLGACLMRADENRTLFADSSRCQLAAAGEAP